MESESKRELTERVLGHTLDGRRSESTPQEDVNMTSSSDSVVRSQNRVILKQNHLVSHQVILNQNLDM